MDTEISPYRDSCEIDDIVLTRIISFETLELCESQRRDPQTCKSHCALT